ncbi:hypothetical protein ADL26_09485 [Thermoactinomyces vulgaris]|nr:hypothetical protein ADL26_09485 [Thermoactinomyces vulgaris]
MSEKGLMKLILTHIFPTVNFVFLYWIMKRYFVLRNGLLSIYKWYWNDIKSMVASKRLTR